MKEREGRVILERRERGRERERERGQGETKTVFFCKHYHNCIITICFLLYNNYMDLDICIILLYCIIILHILL